MSRAGLPHRLRALLLAQAATGAPDHDFLHHVCGAAQGPQCQAGGSNRAEFSELLLQSALFFGFPRAISGFRVLDLAWPKDETSSVPLLAEPIAEPAREDRGQELFAAIYGKNNTTVRAMLQGFHPVFHDFVINEAYGRILARPELPSVERELIAVAGLALQDQVPQLIAHGRGAIAFGASTEAVREAIWCGLRFLTADESTREEGADRLFAKIGKSSR